MTYGPIFPYSAVPLNERTFPWVHVGSGGGSRYEETLGVGPPSGVDLTWDLRFHMPPALPSDGTSPYLDLVCISVASNGDMKVNPKWICAGSMHDPSSFTLGAEGTQTITFTNSAIGKYIQTRIGLDVSSVFAGSNLCMSLVFEQSGYTVDKIVGVIPSIVWV